MQRPSARDTKRKVRATWRTARAFDTSSKSLVENESTAAARRVWAIHELSHDSGTRASGTRAPIRGRVYRVAERKVEFSGRIRARGLRRVPRVARAAKPRSRNAVLLELAVQRALPD